MSAPAPGPGVLFVCTGNVFRSFIAMCAVRQALGPGAGIPVGSAGTVARPQPVREVVLARLAARGVATPRDHRPTRIEPALASRYDLVVAMGLDHRDFLARELGIEAQLFAALAWDTSEGVLDVHEALPDWADRPADAAAYIEAVVDRICEAAPRVAARILARRAA